MVDHCLIINLDKREDLWNNLASFREKWTEHGKMWHRIPGVDYTNELHIINRLLMTNKIDLNGNGFRKGKIPFLGELGCYMGHYNSWKYIVDHKLESCLILEDGITILKDDFQNITMNSKFDLLFVNEEMKMNDNKQFIGYGLQGYVVTQKGAAALMKHCETLSAPIDLQIRHLCNTKMVTATTLSKPFVKRNENRISSIQNEQVSNSENLNDKQDPYPLIQRIIMNLINKNVNLDEYI
jgi:GR25 family glycosyltransferase involved in LPS biosynthesis